MNVIIPSLFAHSIESENGLWIIGNLKKNKNWDYPDNSITKIGQKTEKGAEEDLLSRDF